MDAGLEMSGVGEKTEAWVLLLSGISDRKLRAVSLEGKLSGLGMEEIGSILNHICQKAKLRELPYLKAYHALPELLCSPYFTREAILELRAVARQRDYVEVFRMLLELPPQKLPPLDPDGPEDPFLKDLSLGHRKSLAKSPKMNILRRLFKDQEPAVIRSLLLNPRLTESEILKIASLKPTSPRVLEEIFRSRKWIARHRVKKALVCNPYCPPSIAVHLLKFLLLSDLREIVKFEDLHLAVKEAAHQLLAERCGKVD
jgi:hypothetical protein